MNKNLLLLTCICFLFSHQVLAGEFYFSGFEESRKSSEVCLLVEADGVKIQIKSVFLQIQEQKKVNPEIQISLDCQSIQKYGSVIKGLERACAQIDSIERNLISVVPAFLYDDLDGIEFCQ